LVHIGLVFIPALFLLTSGIMLIQSELAVLVNVGWIFFLGGEILFGVDIIEQRIKSITKQQVSRIT